MNQMTLLAEATGQALSQRGWRLAVAESCTGGWVAKVLTDIAGSSRWFDRGFVSYSNQAKQAMLDVQATTLENSGAVSEKTVIEMANGVLRHSDADISLAISGIAGPDGGAPGKPVGTVCFAWVAKNGVSLSETHHFSGDRDAVRSQAVCYALNGLMNVIQTD